MFVSYVLVVIVTLLVNVQGDAVGGAGPEDMQPSVSVALQDNIQKQMSAAYVYTTAYMKHIVYFARDNRTATTLRQIIVYKYTNAGKLIRYAGNRGLAPSPIPPKSVDLAQCDKLPGCWQFSLSIERELYRALSSLYSAAQTHNDVDMKAIAGSLLQDEMRSIIQVKRILAKLASMGRVVRPAT